MSSGGGSQRVRAINWPMRLLPIRFRRSSGALRMSDKLAISVVELEALGHKECQMEPGLELDKSKDAKDLLINIVSLPRDIQLHEMVIA